MLISCSRTAVGCETSTSPDCTFANDPAFSSFDTHSVWAADPMRAVPFCNIVRNRTQKGLLGLCSFGHQWLSPSSILGVRGEVRVLHEFIAVNRDEIIQRCRAKVATRSIPPPTEVEIDHGVPVFLEQLRNALRLGETTSPEISTSAIRHGHDLLRQGFTVSQVVHDYGDVCQAITELAVELNAPISTEDFRILNRCLDDAIAGAVTEYGRERTQSGIDGESARGSERLGFFAHELRNLINTSPEGPFKPCRTLGCRVPSEPRKSHSAINCLQEGAGSPSAVQRRAMSKPKTPPALKPIDVVDWTGVRLQRLEYEPQERSSPKAMRRRASCISRRVPSGSPSCRMQAKRRWFPRKVGVTSRGTW
jgi:hypothetical protein